MRRSLALLVTPLLILGLLGAGCGGGKKSSDTNAAPSGDARSILSSIQPTAQQGPQKIGLNLAVGLKGTLKDPSAAALLGSGPITVDLSGPVDPTGKAADLRFDLKAGKINLAGGLRLVGDKAFLQLKDKWYELPANTLSSTGRSSTSSIDPTKVLEALGDPSALVKNATVVGSEDIEGIATDHVAGDVDTAELVKAIARIAGAVDAGTTIDPRQITQATAQIEKFVKSAKVDLWIGKDDRQVHRFKVDIDGVLDAATKASSGLDGFTAAITITSTPTDSPSVAAPAGALPSSQLQTDIGPIILQGLGGATP